MKRGEVWWAQLPPPAGRRPVVLLSRNAAYRVRNAVTVAMITRTIRSIPVEAILDQHDGLPTRCVVNADNIMTIPKSSLTQRITTLSTTRMQQVDDAIRFALNLP